MDHITEKFHHGWQKPDPQQLAQLLHNSTILYQPHLKTIKGKQNAHKEFQLFLAWVPEFTGEVISSSLQGNLLFIEWFMYFKFNKRDILKVRAIDKIIIEDLLIKERAVYFNTLKVSIYIIKRPWLWYSYIKYRTAKR